MRLAVLTSHPIQYWSPLFRLLARRNDLVVYFAHKSTPQQQAAAGFGIAFDWDVDLFSDYEHRFLTNVARNPGPHHFAGCDTPTIGQEIVRGRFDALLMTGWGLKSYWQGLWSAKRAAIPVMVRGDSHLGSPRSFPRRLAKQTVYPPLLRMFDAALYVGKRNFEYWRHYQYPTARLFFSPHCVDTAYFGARATDAARKTLRERLGISPQTPVALFAGRLTDFKRPHDVISAANILRARGLDLHLLFAGSGDLESALRAQASQANVRAHFIGFQNQSEMPAAYAASDVLVLPSDARETWGLVANEALACGRPIIVSDAVGCAPDLEAVGGAGEVFSVGQIPQLAQALSKTLGPVTHSAGVEAWNTRYSMEAAAAGIAQACNYLIKQAPS